LVRPKQQVNLGQSIGDHLSPVAALGPDAMNVESFSNDLRD